MWVFLWYNKYMEKYYNIVIDYLVQQLTQVCESVLREKELKEKEKREVRELYGRFQVGKYIQQIRNL